MTCDKLSMTDSGGFILQSTGTVEENVSASMKEGRGRNLHRLAVGISVLVQLYIVVKTKKVRLTSCIFIYI